MALVQLLTTRADLDCVNCGTTQTQQVTLYFDTVTLKLKVEKLCKCYIVTTLDTPYVENFSADITQE
jgi:hypothetical protein